MEGGDGVVTDLELVPLGGVCIRIYILLYTCRYTYRGACIRQGGEQVRQGGEKRIGEPQVQVQGGEGGEPGIW